MAVSGKFPGACIREYPSNISRQIANAQWVVGGSQTPQPLCQPNEGYRDERFSRAIGNGSMTPLSLTSLYLHNNLIGDAGMIEFSRSIASGPDGDLAGNSQLLVSVFNIQRMCYNTLK